MMTQQKADPLNTELSDDEDWKLECFDFKISAFV